METYIINMDKDKANIERTNNELKKINYDMSKVHRFSGVDGNKVNVNEENVHPVCKIFCTNKIIGCGLSHIKLCEKLKNENVKIALILEDDIKTIPNIDLNKEINETIERISKQDSNWDIILLHKQGFCKEYKKINGDVCGSAAAYLISDKGMEKFSNLMLTYHNDFIRNTKKFNSYVGPTLFHSYEDESNITLLNNIMIKDKSFYFWSQQHMMKIPFFNIDIKLLFLLFLILLLTIIKLYYVFVKNKINFIVLFITSILVLFFTFNYYALNDTAYYKCSDITHFFGILFPIIVIFVLFKYLTKNVYTFILVYSLSLSMLVFHLLYHFDKSN